MTKRQVVQTEIKETSTVREKELNQLFITFRRTVTVLKTVGC